MQSEQQELITMLEDSAKHFLRDYKSDPNNPSALWSGMADMGWLGLGLPETHGGAELGLAEITALTRIFGHHGLSNRYIAQCILPSMLLMKASITNPIVTELCEQLINGTALVALAWQEQVGELAINNPNTVIEQGLLSGRKTCVAGADNADVFLVSALHDQQRVILVINRNAAGVTVHIDYQSDLGFGDVHFDEVAIDEQVIILQGENAQTALNHSLHCGQLALAAELEGSASACLDKTLEYIQTRKQFNQMIGSFQAIRHRCVDLLIATRLAQSSWQRAVRQYQEDGSSHCISAAKARCADTAFKIAKESIQMHGAMGFTEEAGIGHFMRTAIARSAWLGSARHHRQQLLTALSTKELSHD